MSIHQWWHENLKVSYWEAKVLRWNCLTPLLLWYANLNQRIYTKACLEFETSSDNLEIQVVQEGTSGFLGFIGSKPAVIKVRKKVQQPCTYRDRLSG